MAKMAIVIALDPAPQDPAEAQAVLDQVKPIFKGKPGVQVYGGFNEVADAIIGFLNDERQENGEGAPDS